MPPSHLMGIMMRRDRRRKMSKGAEVLTARFKSDDMDLGGNVVSFGSGLVVAALGLGMTSVVGLAMVPAILLAMGTVVTAKATYNLYNIVSMRSAGQSMTRRAKNAAQAPIRMGPTVPLVALRH